MITQRELCVYCRILHMIDNCHIVEEDSTGTTIEIDLIQHHKLLDDLANNFFTKKISRRKNWTRLFCWKSVFNNKNLQWFQIKKQHLN